MYSTASTRKVSPNMPIQSCPKPAVTTSPVPHTLEQKTVTNPVVFHGVGLHSGKAVCMIVHPAAIDHGIVFERTDIEDKSNRIHASWQEVSNTHMHTMLTNAAGVSVATVEHLLAALYGIGVTNALITIDGQEVPIMDGCSEEFCKGLLETKLAPQAKQRHSLKITTTVRVENQHGWAQLSPHETNLFSVQFVPSDSSSDRFCGLITPQFLEFSLVNDDFITLVSRARTFGFYEDAQKLWAAGLAKGSSLDNTLVIDKGAAMNADGLRYEDELARHKLLDAIGDMALAEYVLIGHYQACNPGHTLNHQLLQKYFAAVGG